MTAARRSKTVAPTRREGMTVAEHADQSSGHGSHPAGAAPHASGSFERGHIVGASAALSALCGGVMLVRHGAGEHGTRKMLRATGRISMVLFCAAFSASSLDRLLRRPQTAWMVRNRRYLGLGFASSQGIHLLGIVRVFRVSEGAGPPVAPAASLGGSVGYAFIMAMAATSNDAAVRRLGAARWKRLHTAGGRYLLATFVFDLLNGYLKNGRRADVYGPLAALPVVTIACRHLARRVQSDDMAHSLPRVRSGPDVRQLSKGLLRWLRLDWTHTQPALDLVARHRRPTGGAHRRGSRRCRRFAAARPRGASS